MAYYTAPLLDTGGNTQLHNDNRVILRNIEHMNWHYSQMKTEVNSSLLPEEAVNIIPPPSRSAREMAVTSLQCLIISK